MRDVVQHQAADGDYAKVVVGSRGPELPQPIALGMVGQRHEGLETARLVLQLPQADEMVDPFLAGFDRAVKHGAVRFQTQLVGRTMDVEPAVGVDLAAADAVPHARGEYLRPAAGQGTEPGVDQLLQRLAVRHAELRGKEMDLDRREGLQMQSRITKADRPQQVGVVAEREVRVQTVDDMDFRHAGPVTLFDPLQGLLRGHGVRAGHAFLQPRKEQNAQLASQTFVVLRCRLRL